MGRKKLKRKLANRVLAGKLTVGEARARLGREVAQMAQKSARPSWPPQQQQQPAPRYQGDEAYIMSAFAPILRPAVTKSRKAAAQPGLTPQQLLVKARADARAWDICNRLPSPLVKQLSSVDRAMVTQLQRELQYAGHVPARREEINSQLARLTGLPSGGVWPS